ncbi:GORAB family protein [Megaselia abdita]
MSKVKFNGFSQEDINKVNKKSGGDVRVFASRGLRRVGAETESKPTATKPRSNLKASSAVSVPVNKQKNEVKPIEEKTANDTTLDELIDMDESMSTSLEEAMFYKPRSKRKPEKRDDSDDDEKVEEVSIVRGVSLKDFQSHQKLMQEQNKQKKDLLYKAIEQHTQKTAAEWKKMEEIKFELSKLDSELASDVAILRKQIDLACINYSNIE